MSAVAASVIALERVTSRVPTMSCRRTDEQVFAAVRDAVDDIVLVEDSEMAEAARWLWFEMGIAAELSGAAAVAALLAGKLIVEPGKHVCAIVCGAGTDGMR